MEKRFILTIALSAIVLMAWSLIIPQQKQTSEGKTRKIAEPAAKSDIPQREYNEPQPSELFEFSTSKYKIIFDEKKAAIREIIFKDFQSANLLLHNGLEILNLSAGFKKINMSPEQIVFLFKDQEKEITKRFVFSPDYSLDLEIEIKNLSTSDLAPDLPVALGTIDFSKNDAQSRYQSLAIVQSGKLLQPNPFKENTFNQPDFLGIRERYFCIITQPTSKDDRAFIRKIDSKRSEIALDLKNFVSVPHGTGQKKMRFYLGPQQIRLINAVNPNWAGIVHYGTFDFISQILLKILDILYNIMRNWGLAIIFMSVAIYFLLYPLTLKQMRSMKEMQLLQPRIEELKKAYKDNPQKMNKEVMELYKEHKVNPLGGCLPLILQMPIFFALYQALMRSVVLKGARFLWIKDLSEPDRLVVLPTALPILGNEINLLPLLMMIGMFFQQRLSMSASVGASNEQQKMMLILFPLLFGFIFYHMPAGLVMYWFVNNVLMLFNQLKINKIK